MDSGETHSWTFGRIVISFIDLAVAYFLLCGSALAFFGSKICNLFGLYLPCPCIGIFGYQNRDLCLHRLFVELPLRIICYVQWLAKSGLPFDHILFQDQARNLNLTLDRDRKCGKQVPEVNGEGEESCSSFSCMSSLNLGNRECGYDTKGKRSVNQKQRSGNRRQRRVSLEYGKFSSAQSPVYCSQTVSAGAPVFQSTESDMKLKTDSYTHSGPVYVDEDNLQGDAISSTSMNMSEKSWYRFQRSLSFEESKGDAPSAGKIETKTEDKAENFGNEAKSMARLEHALEEEKAAYLALQLDLEKERAAAASATDEAMTMILRLQKEKASLEMEAIHYQRLIEEKFAHDEDEMNVLKEILVRRERENHFLEKELEEYRRMSSSQDEQFFNDVHVIDDETQLHEPKNENCYEPCSALGDHSNSSRTEPRSYVCGSEIDISGESESENSSNNNGFRRKSLYGVKIDSEVERLREMLRVVQDGKQKLHVSVEKSETENAQSEILAETLDRLQEVKHLQEPL